MRQDLFPQIARFGVVGILATAVHLFVAIVLNTAAGVAPLRANMGGFAAALVVSYLFNLRWTFERSWDHCRYAPRFLLTALLGFGVGHTIVFLGTEIGGLPFVTTLLATIAVVPATNYLLMRYWTFAASDPLATKIMLRFASIAGLAAYAAILSTTRLNHDTQWYLISVAWWLDGAQLYRDILEINPPLAFILTVPPVALAKLLDLRSATIFVFYATALAGASLAATNALLSRYPGMDDVGRRWLMAGAALALLIYPLPQFGQREHLMLMLVLPYLVLTAMRAAGSNIGSAAALFVGVAAGIGLALKPYFAIVPLLLAASALWRFRSIRAAATLEHQAIAVVLVGYVALAVTVFPLYFSEILPIARLTYSAGFDLPLRLIVIQSEFSLWAVSTIFVMLRFRRDPVNAALLSTFVVAGLGFAISYLVQQKGWFYHRMPLGGCLVMLAATLAIEFRSSATAHSVLRSGLVALAILAGTVGSSLVEGPYRNELPDIIRSRVPHLNSSTRVYAFGQWLRPGVSVAADLGGRWCSRYPALWPVPGAVAQVHDPKATVATRDEARGVIQAIRDAVIEDFNRCRPTLVVVEPAPRRLLRQVPDFSYLALLRADERFEAIWRDYRRVELLPSGYEVWERAPLSPHSK